MRPSICDQAYATKHMRPSICAYMTKHAWQNKAPQVAAIPTSTAAAASSSVAAATAPRAASGAGPAKKTKRGKKKKQAQSGV